MLKITKSLIFTLILSSLLSIVCFASENITPINDLVEKSSEFDNKQVTVKGEAIGETLERKENAWININDTTNAIGIWLSKKDSDMIKYYGDYKNKGDTVEITGVFYKACVEHGGDVDIHCTDIKIVESGHKTEKEIPSVKIIVTAVLLLSCIIVALVYLKLNKKSAQK